jgi:phage/plasmid-associated DNA primase
MPFQIYFVKSYKLRESDFDSNLLQFDTIDELVEELNNCKLCYHFRIHPNTTYIFFGDLDNYPKSIEHFTSLLKEFMNNFYNLEFNVETDFKYTKNNVKQGSYHYSIPKWNLSTEKLKEIHQEFIKNYKSEFIINSSSKDITCVDTTIYSEHWFRCPNQVKGDSKNNAVHEIIVGVMKDFIIDYIPSNSINIDNIQLITSDNVINKTSNSRNIMIMSNILPHTSNTTIIENNSQLSNISINQRTEFVEITEQLLSNAISKCDIYKKLFDDCFLPPRFTTYDNWMKVGMAIKNTIEDYNEALQLYIYYSSKGINYEGIDSTTKKFNSYKIKNNGYGVGTIYKMALEDNKINAIRIIETNKLQFQSTDFCQFIKVMAGNQYLYKKIGSNYLLYCFNGKKWQQDDVLLRHFISNELYELLKDLLINVYWNSLGQQFQIYKNKLDKLKMLSFKKEIIETYKEYNARTDINFDDKWWLFGFNNLVYDMKTRQFRDYELEDYITITSGYDWREPTIQEIETVRNLINCIMPIEAEREAFLQILASGIDGMCPEKFIIFNGAGGNGKGVINDMMLIMLGCYGMLGNNNMLFENSKMGSNPEKANLHKKRYVVFREPSSNKKFENSIIKELSGGGKFSARGHYESDTQKEINATLVCECNDKPAFSEAITQAEVRRIIDIYFKCNFTTNESDINHSKFCFKAEPRFKTKEFQEQHKFALFKILTEYHYKYYFENNSVLKMPNSIVTRTNKYLENSCDLVSWFQFEYRQDEDVTPSSYIKISDIYQHFITSESYISLSKSEKQKYQKLKFFEFIKTNIFFKKYYIDRYNDIRNLLVGWYRQDNIDY